MAELAANANVLKVRRTFQAFTTGNAAGADEFVSPSYVDHDARDACAASRPGPARFRESVRWLHRVFADLEFEEREVVAAGDRVMVRGIMRGKHVGPLLGFAPTGMQVEVHQVHIFRLNGDKVAEHRAVWAELSLLVQLISERL